jgi:hypothetical protein
VDGGLVAAANLFSERNTFGWWLVCFERKILLTGG